MTETNEPQAEDAKDDVCQAVTQFQIGGRLEVTASCIVVESEHGERHANFEYTMGKSPGELVEIRFAWPGTYTDKRPAWAEEILKS